MGKKLEPYAVGRLRERHVRGYVLAPPVHGQTPSGWQEKMPPMKRYCRENHTQEEDAEIGARGKWSRSRTSTLLALAGPVPMRLRALVAPDRIAWQLSLLL